MQSADAPSLVNPILALVPPEYRAATSMCLTAVSFSIMSVLIKQSYELGAHQFQVVGFRAIFGWLPLIPWLLFVGFPGLETRIPMTHFLRSIIGFCAMVLLFSSFRFLPMSQVISLNFSTPLFTLLFAVLLFGEKVRLRRTIAGVLGFIGMLIIVQPWNNARFDLLVILPISAAILMGIVPHILRRMAGSESTDVMVFYQGFWMTLLSMPLMIWFWSAVPTITYVWMILAGFAGYVGQTFFVEATHRGDASQIMLFDYIRLPLITLAEFVVFLTVPDPWIVPGVFLIAGSTIYIARREAYLTRPKKYHQQQ